MQAAKDVRTSSVGIGWGGWGLARAHETLKSVDVKFFERFTFRRDFRDRETPRLDGLSVAILGEHNGCYQRRLGQ